MGFERLQEDKLYFDRKNPRLVEFGLTDQSTQQEILRILWDAMDVREVAMSIVASGFFEHDPLIIAKEENKLVVIEGNRRLAAVRSLLYRDDYKGEIPNIPEPTDKIIQDIKNIPVVYKSREESWKFLGFKHVNGPAKWGSYAKAKYISDVHLNYKVPLEQIGRQIGDTHKTVQRLFAGLMVIEQAEREHVFDRADVERSSFYFSHIYVGLQREGIKQFLSIASESDEKENPVPPQKIKELGELCRWLYGSKKDEVEPLVQSQNPNLKQLDLVLQNREALSALRSDVPLETALELTKSVPRLFEDELLSAKRSLIKARGLITEGYGGSMDLLKIAGSIADIADDLYTEMERKTRPTRKSRISEEN